MSEEGLAIVGLVQAPGIVKTVVAAVQTVEE
jgi:hypothetical protein